MNITATGVSTFMPNLSGGKYIVSAFGTFGSASIAVQQSPDCGTTWIPLSTSLAQPPFTSASSFEATLGEGLLRFVTSNSIGTNLSVFVIPAGDGACVLK